MEERFELLKQIVNSELLAPSLGTLSMLLGYNTKSTLYRIARGEAKSASIVNFCKLLNDRLNIDDNTLRQMSLLLNDYDYLSSRLKHESARKEPEKIVLSLINDDYTLFSKQFVEEDLPVLIRYRHDSPIAFYRLLFYYYVRKSFVTFYSKDMTYIEECKRVITPLATMLRQIFPDNYQGKEYIDMIGNEPIFDEYASTLWGCVAIGGKLLMYYASPDSYQEALSSFVLLPGINERSYWFTENPKLTVMALAIEARRKRSGFYALFSVDLNDNNLQCIGYLAFSPDGKVQLSGTGESSHKICTYTFTGTTLSINLGESSLPFNVGTRWHLMNIDTIPVIKEFNCQLDDQDIHAAMLRGQGIEEMPDYAVKDVVLTRSEVRLRLKSGKELVIDRDAYEFLGNIQPTDTVVVARRIKNRFEYVAWTDYNHIIPLAEFRQE